MFADDGRARRRRTFDGIWESLPVPAQFNNLSLGYASPGMMLDGGATWIPITIPLPSGLPPTATLSPTTTPPSTPTRTPTATVSVPTATPAACYEGLANGGFETNAAWIIRTNPVLAAYVPTPAHGGQRSMRTGIPAGGANVLSDSPIEQAVTFPAALAMPGG